MKRLVAVAAFAMACIATFSMTSTSAMAQRGRQGEARTLTGRVLNNQSEPLQKAIVYLKNTKTLVIKTYITETDGSYRFPALATNVDYEVYAEFQGGRSDTKTLSGFDSRKDPNITLKVHSR
jgi:hypothetical protein